MRKPRSDAVLLNLPEEQQCKLADWLLSGVPYHEAKILAEKEFGVSLKSLSPFKEFWQQVCQPHLLARRSRSLGAAGVRAEEAAKHSGAAFDTATLDALRQKAYELAESPGAEAKEVKAVMMLLLKARDQDFEREKLAFDRQRFEFDAAQACLKQLPELKAISSNRGLNQTEKVEQIRLRLFGTLSEAEKPEDTD